MGLINREPPFSQKSWLHSAGRVKLEDEADNLVKYYIAHGSKGKNWKRIKYRVAIHIGPHTATMKPNILLVIMDSVRAKNLSLYNHQIQTTPFLESFAEEATVYFQTRAPGIHSIASHASIFSGYHVEEHGLFEHKSQLDPRASIWPELSKNHDYSTALFSPNVIITQSSNLDEHFQYTVGPKKRIDQNEGLTPADLGESVSIAEYISEAIRHEKTLQSLINGYRAKFRDQVGHNPETEQATTYLSEFFDWEKHQDTPWAACINLMDAHYPYVAEPEFWFNDKKIRDLLDYFNNTVSREVLSDGGWWVVNAFEYLYDECIRQVDAAINSLINELKKKEKYDNTLIVITSDHGEAFGEYSQVSPSVRLCDHSWGIHEVQTHVPLLVKYPGQQEPRQQSALSSLTEFPNVVRETINGKRSPSFVPDSGKVLSSTFRIPKSSDLLPPQVETTKYVGPWRAIYENTSSGFMKYSTHKEDGAIIRGRTAQHWFVESRSYPAQVDTVFSSLTNAGVDMGISKADEEVEERLEALGYMR